MIFISACQLFLGANGVERIIELELTDEEKAQLKRSAEAVEGVKAALKSL